MDDGRTTEPAYTISSPNQPKGSGELKVENVRHVRLFTRQEKSGRKSGETKVWKECHVRME